MTCHDYSNELMEMINTAVGVPSDTQIEKFAFRVKSHIFKNQTLKNLYRNYRYIKINWIRVQIEVQSISFSRYFKTDKEPRQWVGAPGINEFGKIPVFILWNLDTHVPANPSIELVRDSIHAKKIHVGGKPAKFIYRVPRTVRKYMDTKVLNDCDPDNSLYNDMGKYLSFVSSMGNFRAPNMFYGVTTLSLEGLDSSIVLANVYPIKFLFTVKTSVNVTCKGFSDMS